MEIKVISYGSDLYRKSVELREKILRHPLGMKFTEESLKQDKDCIHIVAMDKNRVIGTTVLKHIDRDTVRIRQVAVDYEYRGQKIGFKLMEFAENLAREQGYKKALLHARYYVIPFYKKLGYKIAGEKFHEIGLEHRLMIKNF